MDKLSNRTFVLGRFSYFDSEIAYSHYTFLGAWTPSFYSFRCEMSKFSKTNTPLVTLMNYRAPIIKGK